MHSIQIPNDTADDMQKLEIFFMLSSFIGVFFVCARHAILIIISNEKFVYRHAQKASLTLLPLPTKQPLHLKWKYSNSKDV